MLGLCSALVYAVTFGDFWALWLFSSCAALVSTILFWVFVSWRPGRGAPISRVADIVPVASGIASNSLLDFTARTYDKILIGRLLGSEPLGLYDRVYKIVLLPLLFVNIPLERLLVPLLSRSLTDPVAYRRIYQNGLQISLLLVAPAIAVAAANAVPVVRLLFGPEWVAAAPIFLWLSIACLAQLATQTLTSVWISQGRTTEMAMAGALGTAAVVLAFSLGSLGGMVTMAASYAACELLKLPVLFWWAARSGPIGMRHYVEALLPFAVSFPLAAWLSLELRGTMPTMSLTLLACEFGASFLLALSCLAITRPGRSLLTSLMRRRRAWHGPVAPVWEASTSSGPARQE